MKRAGKKLATLIESKVQYVRHYNLGFVYISNSLFEGQKRSFKEVISENSALMYG